jgi:hypothetical protein
MESQTSLNPDTFESYEAFEIYEELLYWESYQAELRPTVMRILEYIKESHPPKGLRVDGPFEVPVSPDSPKLSWYVDFLNESMTERLGRIEIYVLKSSVFCDSLSEDAEPHREFILEFQDYGERVIERVIFCPPEQYEKRFGFGLRTFDRLRHLIPSLTGLQPAFSDRKGIRQSLSQRLINFVRKMNRRNYAR